jgi:drug/metabolite transporter (DMT)-like permease
VATANANLRGIMAICASMVAYTVNDAMVKEIARTNPIGEVIFIRGIFTTLLLCIAVVALGHVTHTRGAVSRPVINRSFFDGVSSACFVIALVHMKLADLAAVLQVMPLILSALSVLIYREAVGWRRWTAIFVGFAGALIIIKPTPGAFDAWALVALLAATSSALREIQTRRIDPGVPTVVVALMGSIAILLVGLSFIVVEQWRMLPVRDIAMLAVAALFVAMATYCMTLAFRNVDLSVVAPFRYSYLITSAIAGYLVFAELPDQWSLLGAALIVASGLYALHREAARRRSAAAPAGQGRRAGAAATPVD